MSDLLKFITCGSVDDGKSTLIGRMLYDAKLLFADQVQALELDSQVGSRDGKIDYSLLLDGLMAEREQGITIDVAYRFFTTEKRSFIVADTPGHEQYTRNMAVGASFADVAVILVDASKGILTQTKRHTRISVLMGIKHFILAINKMDLVDYDKHIYDKITYDFRSVLSEYDGIEQVEVIPVSATEGDNVKETSKKTPWYQGKTLFDTLETMTIESKNTKTAFIMPVQRVTRPNHTFRGFQGQVEQGQLNIGDTITVLPSKEQAKVKSLYNTHDSVNEIHNGEAVTIQLDHEIDISRGNVITTDHGLHVTNMMSADLLWMDEVDLIQGKNYLLKLGTKTLPCSIMKIKYKIDINDGSHLSTSSLKKNELAHVDIVLSEPLVFESFNENTTMGGFILIDRLTHMTSGVGTVSHELRRSENVQWQELDITRDIRASQKMQKPLTIWFTGLSGSGKSTLANELEKRLVAMGKHTILLDGDNIRHGLNRDLGFTEEDRIENIRRISEVAKLMNDAGLIVITSFISPFESDREEARKVIGESFKEVYVSTPLEVCEKRDIKGLYAKARLGDIPNFTGINSPYEIPQSPDVVVDTTNKTIQACLEDILSMISNHY
jgi:bifunctional enzyme CysN/CysC